MKMFTWSLTCVLLLFEVTRITNAEGELNVTPEPKTRELKFAQPVYDLQVSEATSINSTVATIIALRPEEVVATYSIVMGDELRQFAIGYESGVIRVVRKLDRELLSCYQLLIKAEDSRGLSGTATVNIDVTADSGKIIIIPTVALDHETQKLIKAEDSRSLSGTATVNINVTDGSRKIIITPTAPLEYDTQEEHKLGFGDEFIIVIVIILFIAFLLWMAAVMRSSKTWFKAFREQMQRMRRKEDISQEEPFYCEIGKQDSEVSPSFVWVNERNGGGKQPLQLDSGAKNQEAPPQEEVIYATVEFHSNENEEN